VQVPDRKRQNQRVSIVRRTGHRVKVAIIAVPLIAAVAIFVGVISWRDWQNRSKVAWLSDVIDLTPGERIEISEMVTRARDRGEILAELKGWDRCVKEYHRDGAADALSDFKHHHAQPYWGHSGGFEVMEWVPGLEASCAPPPSPSGVNLPPEVTSRRGNFRELDQMGAEFEDAQWRIGLTERCDRTSRTYAATYNRRLAKLDPGAFRQCRAVTEYNKVSYRY
jgi:hypothetical protein